MEQRNLGKVERKSSHLFSRSCRLNLAKQRPHLSLLWNTAATLDSRFRDMKVRIVKTVSLASDAVFDILDEDGRQAKP